MEQLKQSTKAAYHISFVYVPNLPTVHFPCGLKSSHFQGYLFSLKHDHPDAPPCSFIFRGIHPSEALRAPIIEIEVKQAIARSELYQ